MLRKQVCFSSVRNSLLVRSSLSSRFSRATRSIFPPLTGLSIRDVYSSRLGDAYYRSPFGALGVVHGWLRSLPLRTGWSCFSKPHLKNVCHPCVIYIQRWHAVISLIVFWCLGNACFVRCHQGVENWEGLRRNTEKKFAKEIFEFSRGSYLFLSSQCYIVVCNCYVGQGTKISAQKRHHACRTWWDVIWRKI